MWHPRIQVAGDAGEAASGSFGTLGGAFSGARRPARRLHPGQRRADLAIELPQRGGLQVLRLQRGPRNAYIRL